MGTTGTSASLYKTSHKQQWPNMKAPHYFSPFLAETNYFVECFWPETGAETQIYVNFII